MHGGRGEGSREGNEGEGEGVQNFTLLQMMNYLKRDLTTLEVEYTEKVFNSADGVGGLGPEPFVSLCCIILLLLVLDTVLHQH